jgi:hypothetical protein
MRLAAFEFGAPAMRRKKIIVCLSAAVLSAAALVVLPRIGFFMLTGRFFPIHKIERLNNSVPVKSWTPEGLALSDGRTVLLPGIHALPGVSPALTEMTKRGVEIAPNGNVYGLVRIHHWCGNDPVREDIVRVDLAEAMTFLHVGRTDAPVPQSDSTAREAGGRFTEWGWNISEYFQFLYWRSMKGSIQ